MHDCFPRGRSDVISNLANANQQQISIRCLLHRLLPNAWHTTFSAYDLTAQVRAVLAPHPSPNHPLTHPRSLTPWRARARLGSAPLIQTRGVTAAQRRHHQALSNYDPSATTDSTRIDHPAPPAARPRSRDHQFRFLFGAGVLHCA